MRTTPTAHPNTELLVYGIREIVDVANKIKGLDPALELTWENIGDPVAKGWSVPQFLKEILTEEIHRADNRSFAYTHSRGNIETRKWAVTYAKQFCPSSTLDYEDILFTNGLGSGIAMLYQMVAPGKRILQPSPTYPTHASFESFCSGNAPIFYKLDPEKGWAPDIADIEAQLQNHPDIVGITVINPNNPTGTIYSQETLEAITRLAEKYNVMIISDEIYFRMVFPGHTHVHMAELAHARVPLIVLRGLSKDIPWPGGRCGWLEFHNTDLDPAFKDYCEAVKKRVLLEVCASTLPQMVIPTVYNHPQFNAWNQQYSTELQTVADSIADTLNQIPELTVNKTLGAFYLMPRFKQGSLNNRQTLPITNPQVKAYIEQAVATPNLADDKRFTYYILANTGIVCVPASDFFSPYPGFRLTTLSRNPEERKKTYERFAEATKAYLGSG
ncbi:aminotransferase [Candidatus Peregrinibacteria bacterium CG11_big_fil_rev_8_21_14_0_20_41_10]|nr:MAG: aminotransferase [Candidatus Peregrinibacteria bacterium CG11_big_fil_rev_8_21_14_0_20_41_10]